MKTLIVSTAKDELLLSVWLPSLLNNAKYTGDILLLDYDMSIETRTKIANSQVYLYKVERQDKPIAIASSRWRELCKAFSKLDTSQYDIIMLADGDLQFFVPLEPLFEQAKDVLCYVTESRDEYRHFILDVTYEYKHDFKLLNLIFPNNFVEIFASFEKERQVNGGMIVGPTKYILEYLKYISDNMSVEEYYGEDQLLLNAFVYYFKPIPVKEVDDVWNYICVLPWVTIKDKCYSVNGWGSKKLRKEIYILHRVGRHDKGKVIKYDRR
jgi:hypothetical protein